ncbi:MAG: FecR family protein [Cyclobacteriaceae bacterium]
METQEHIDDLIGKVLTGEASEQEQAQVEAWRSQRAANEQYFVQCRQILEEAGRAPEFHYDERAAWERVKSTMHAGSRSRSFPVWRVAAAVAVVALAGYAISRWYVEPIQQLSLRSEHAITTDTLPDGSVAVMNRQTRIEYAEARTDNQRRVKLTGEAYFDVRHLEEKPFVIETAEEVLIRDIGTSFNVRAFPSLNRRYSSKVVKCSFILYATRD